MPKRELGRGIFASLLIAERYAAILLAAIGANLTSDAD